MADPRDAAVARLLAAVPARSRRRVRRLLATPFAPPVLVSLPTDHLVVRAPIPRPPGRRAMAVATLRRWRAESITRARRLARRLRDAWRRF